MIETSGHLPECRAHQERGGWCICPALRACEARVDQAWHEYDQLAREGAYRSGVQDAHDAVEAVGQQHPKWGLMSTHYEDCWKHHSECALTLALSAIDALRGEA